MQLIEKAHSRFRIVNVSLPLVEAKQQEIIPIVVDERSGLPLRLALRWAVRERRIAVGEKTLSDDLRAAALLYAFCEDELDVKLDDFFVDGGRLTSPQLDSLIDYLREGKGGARGIRALTTTAQLIANIERFLRWLAKPSERGGSAYVPATELVIYFDQMSLVFSELRAFRSRGQRKPPLSSERDAALQLMVGPQMSKGGTVLSPIKFGEANPWKHTSRLRNWIAYRLARECGLRRGEVGKLRIDDVRNVGGEPAIAVRRRPYDPADTRKSTNRPKVKTVERELPISQVLAMGIRQYSHSLLRDGGRRGASTPYLLVTSDGKAISGSSLDAVWKAVNARLYGDRMSWHVLRHTWAEETAEGLLEEHRGTLDSADVALGILKELGGWAPTSSTPFRYIQNAVRKHGNAYLRKRNARFDAGLEK